MTFDRDDYQAWREKRFDFIVKHYGATFFQGKNLLEVGAGYGHLGNMFHNLGSRVSCTDGRPENVEGIRQRFPHLTSFVCDIENDFPAGHFDVCIHMGVLYHIKNAVESLRRACDACDNLVLETETVDSTDPCLTKGMDERLDWLDTAVSGHGVRLTAAGIEQIVSEQGKVFTRRDATELNSGIHRYDWSVANSEGYGAHFRRLWFIARNGK